MTADIERTVGFCAGLPRPVRVAYEAGPTGYGLAARARQAAGGVCGRGAVEDPAGVGGQGEDRSLRRGTVGAVAAGGETARRPGAGGGGGGVAGSGPCPGAGARRSDALPASALEAAVASRDPVR